MSDSDFSGMWAQRPMAYAELIRKAVASHPQPTADIMANLAWSVLDEDEALEFLQRCVDLAVRIIGGAHSAGVTAKVHGNPFTAVHTDSLLLKFDSRQYEVGAGPCLHAMATGQLVHVDVAASRERWPEFAADAAEVGVCSFLAAPLGTDTECLGAINLYSKDHNGFTDADAVLLQLLVEHAARSLGDYARLWAAHDLSAQLRAAMTHRAPIEQAKGILMAAHGTDAATAFGMLRLQSQNSNTKLRDLAADFVARHSTPTDPNTH